MEMRQMEETKRTLYVEDTSLPAGSLGWEITMVQL